MAFVIICYSSHRKLIQVLGRSGMSHWNPVDKEAFAKQKRRKKIERYVIKKVIVCFKNLEKSKWKHSK